MRATGQVVSTVYPHAPFASRLFSHFKQSLDSCILSRDLLVLPVPHILHPGGHFFPGGFLLVNSLNHLRVESINVG